MTTEPEEHDFIAQVCAQDAESRVPPRLSDDPAVRLAECRGEVTFTNCYQDQTTSIFLGRVVQTFDETAERVKFERQIGSSFRARWPDGDYRDFAIENQWQGWLACSKSRAEVK